MLGPAIEKGELPLLGALAQQGSLYLDCVSIFPSITPAATASIITGRYPSRHGIAGMAWWDPATHEVLYLGDDVGTVLKRGIGEYLRNFLLRLNGEQLTAPTLFQLVERHHRRAACTNYLVFRGDRTHRVSPGLPLSLHPSFREPIEVQGPSWLCLGDFVATTGGPLEVKTSAGGMFHRFGLDDDGTAAFLRSVPDSLMLPDFTVAYFADYDFDSHQRGPVAAFDTLQRVDSRLMEIVDAWGGLDRVLRDTSIVVTSDHAQSCIGHDADCAIDLEDILSDYRVANPGAGWRDDDELLLCPNMRSAEIYLRDGSPGMVQRICRALLTQAGVDHVPWSQSDDVVVVHVATRDRGSLRFQHAGGGDAIRDEYGGAWECHGDLEAVDASIADGRLRYGAYPNALERIANGVGHPRAGRVWVTTRPGSEFRQPDRRCTTTADCTGPCTSSIRSFR